MSNVFERITAIVKAVGLSPEYSNGVIVAEMDDGNLVCLSDGTVRVVGDTNAVLSSLEKIDLNQSKEELYEDFWRALNQFDDLYEEATIG